MKRKNMIRRMIKMSRTKIRGLSEYVDKMKLIPRRFIDTPIGRVQEMKHLPAGKVVMIADKRGIYTTSLLETIETAMSQLVSCWEASNKFRSRI